MYVVASRIEIPKHRARLSQVTGRIELANTQNQETLSPNALFGGG